LREALVKTVQDILERKGRSVWWIDPLESVHAAARLMSERKVGALLVQIDEYLVGIVSERDYIKVILGHESAHKTKVSEIMTRDVISVTRADTPERCVALMKAHHIRHLPVVEEGKALGVISVRDLLFGLIPTDAE
jgi:signal-transduction protein with cAMP-binding, CBS, and nucleotidyltransferase domain